jgi:hypothetical protein
MRVLSSFTKSLYCSSHVQRYLQPHRTGLLLNLFIEVLLTHVPIHLRILVQGDGVAFLIDTCWVKDPDRALIFQCHYPWIASYMQRPHQINVLRHYKEAMY